MSGCCVTASSAGRSLIQRTFGQSAGPKVDGRGRGAGICERSDLSWQVNDWLVGRGYANELKESRARAPCLLPTHVQCCRELGSSSTLQVITLTIICQFNQCSTSPPLCAMSSCVDLLSADAAVHQVSCGTDYFHYPSVLFLLMINVSYYNL